MRLFWKILLLVSTLFVAAMLTHFSLVPTYVLQVSVVPRSSKGIEMRRDKVVFINNGKEPIVLDVAGEVDNPTVSEVVLSMHDPNQLEFKTQGSFKVAGGSFLGTVQLGSAEAPITSDENFTYVIESGDDKSRLSEGSIQVLVKAIISGTSQWWMIIVAGMGLLASVLQITSFLRTEKTSRNRSSERIAEPVALDGLNSPERETTHEA